MNLEEVMFEAEEGMEKAVEFMIHEFAMIRTGKASPSLIDNLDVQAYGSSMKLKQLALISAPEPRLLLVQPFDAGTTRDIEKALLESKLGINPAVDGKLIRIPIPELSEQRRKELAKTVKQQAEDGRVRVRACRRTAMEAVGGLQKKGELSEDDLKVAEEDIQKLTDKHIESIKKHVETKEKELMQI